MSDATIPKGYMPMPPDNTFTDVFGPLYISVTEAGPSIGVLLEERHLNAMGICHGAVPMALLDIAFACSVGFSAGKFVGTPTININLDFMSAAKAGEWLYTDATCLKLTNTMGFAKGVVRTDSEIKVGGSGVFKLPSDIDAAAGPTVDEVLKMHGS